MYHRGPPARPTAGPGPWLGLSVGRGGPRGTQPWPTAQPGPVLRPLGAGPTRASRAATAPGQWPRRPGACRGLGPWCCTCPTARLGRQPRASGPGQPALAPRGPWHGHGRSAHRPAALGMAGAAALGAVPPLAVSRSLYSAGQLPSGRGQAEYRQRALPCLLAGQGAGTPAVAGQACCASGTAACPAQAGVRTRWRGRRAGLPHTGCRAAGLLARHGVAVAVAAARTRQRSHP